MSIPHNRAKNRLENPPKDSSHSTMPKISARYADTRISPRQIRNISSSQIQAAPGRNSRSARIRRLPPKGCKKS
jgi:hypothetical protein